MSKFKLIYEESLFNDKIVPVIEVDCHDIELYPYNTHMGIGFSKELSYAGVVYPAISTDKKWVIQCIFHSKRPSIGVIAHESSHIIEELEKQIGQDLVGEARSYLTEYVVEQIYNYTHKKQEK